MMQEPSVSLSNKDTNCLLHRVSLKTLVFTVSQFEKKNAHTKKKPKKLNAWFVCQDERVGNLTVVTNDSETIPKIRSQMTTVVRINYSNPPAHGARVAATILNNKALFDEW